MRDPNILRQFTRDRETLLSSTTKRKLTFFRLSAGVFGMNNSPVSTADVFRRICLLLTPRVRICISLSLMIKYHCAPYSGTSSTINLRLACTGSKVGSHSSRCRQFLIPCVLCLKDRAPATPSGQKIFGAYTYKLSLPDLGSVGTQSFRKSINIINIDHMLLRSV